MLDERARRRAGFRGGRGILLGDGGEWTFPAPAEGASEWDPELAGLIGAVSEAEDRADRLRCELALAIALLSRNYELGPAEYRTLFGFRPGGAELAGAQAAFRALAMEHARAQEGRAAPRLVGASTGRGRPLGWAGVGWGRVRAGLGRLVGGQGTAGLVGPQEPGLAVAEVMQ